MKTISITLVVLIIMIAAAYSAERPLREEIKVRARYTLAVAENAGPHTGSLFEIGFPSAVTEMTEVTDLVPSESKSAMFRDPQEITEEGLSERAFQISLPVNEVGDPSEITVPEGNVREQFRNPAAITEEGLTEKAFQISYPAPVIGSPSDIQAHELKRIPARG
ncbi:MAG TPA: hypothetical protein VGE15_11225 [Sphingobacteriaceae bacterium]